MHLGVRSYGVHINGYTSTDEGLKMWVARRSRQKPTWPSKLDHIVAGGQVFKQLVDVWWPNLLALSACTIGILLHSNMYCTVWATHVLVTTVFSAGKSRALQCTPSLHHFSLSFTGWKSTQLIAFLWLVVETVFPFCNSYSSSSCVLFKNKFWVDI